MRDDLKHAMRSLRTSPTFTAVALAVLALGIGAGTAIFSVVDGVILRGLPFDEYDRLVTMLEHDTKRATTFGAGVTTSQTYLDWRRLQQSFEGLAAIGSRTFRLKTEIGEPDEARGQRVTSEFFTVLRVAPLLGRAFVASDELVGRDRLVILSYGFWQRRFGGSPEVIGKTIDLASLQDVHEQSWQIVGVMPRGFSYPVGTDRPAELFVPLAFTKDDQTRGTSHNYTFTTIARLRPGVTLEQAQDHMNRIATGLEEQFPNWSPGRRVRVLTLHDHLVGRVRSWMVMLLGAVGLVLLIACANVANLMLARSTVRRREIAVRTALGAGRWRLIRLLLVEGIVLSLAGAALGLLIAYGGIQVLRAWLPAGLPRVSAIAMDVRVLGAAVTAAFVTGMLFSVVPALQTSRVDVIAALKEGTRAATPRATAQRLRNALVVSEVAVAVMLLVGAGLFIASFVRLIHVDVGFDYRHVLTLNVGLGPQPGTPDEVLQRRRIYLRQVFETVSRVPGVEKVAAVVGGVPLTGSWSRTDVALPGRDELKGDDASIDQRIVTPDYLKVLRIPILRGRDLTDADRDGTTPVVVVNQTAARTYWPDGDPLGQRITINRIERAVVGITADIRHLGPERPVRQEAYIPAWQDRNVPHSMVVRTTADPMRLLSAVKAAIWSVNKEQRLTDDTVTLEAYMDRLIAERRFNMALLATFGALGLVIAAAGIYGVMAYVVALRTNEIGVRIALGATRRNVVSMVIRKATMLMIAGLAVGGVGAWYAGASVNAFLFQVEATDIRIFVSAFATLALTGLAASAIPARRAANVDPMIALRQE
jgi:predicted permease